MISRMIRACSSASTSGTGVYAPMPPVLGPRSSSNTVLWSWAAASGTTDEPLENAKNDASSPTMNSSTTTVAPAAPNSRRSMHWAMAASASSSVAHTMAPLPAASPSVFTTSGAPSSRA